MGARRTVYIYRNCSMYFPACNVVSTQSEGFFTIDNPGEQRNCSVLIVYPEKLEILQMNIGKKSKKQLARSISTFGKIGIFHEFNQVTSLDRHPQ